MKNLKAWHYIAIVLVLGALSYLVFGSNEDDQLGSVTVKNGSVIHEDSMNHKNITNKTNVQNSGVQVLPPRVLSAPSYDVVIMAARIINEAVDQDVAKEYVSLITSQRNYQLLAQNAKLKSEISKYEADNARSQADIQKTAKGDSSYSSDYSMHPMNSAMPMNIADGSQPITTGSAKKSTQIKLTSLDSKRSEMIISIDGDWFKNVKSGQTISGYQVGLVDKELKCVPLTKNEKSIVICLN